MLCVVFRGVPKLFSNIAFQLNIGMFIALMLVAFNFLGAANSGFSVFGIALYLAMFSIGIGPGAW